jgi:cytochrome c oxidase subunit 4
MHDAHAVDIDKHVRIYITVFVTLMALTLITVAVSYLHLPIRTAIAVALVIASVKGSLVACYFMHLISERRLIFAVLGLTVAFFAGLLLLPVLSHEDRVATTGTPIAAPAAPAAEGHH